MKTGANTVAMALAGVLASAQAPLHATDSWSSLKMRPMQAVSLDAGDKHIVSYFMSDGDVCKLTLMMDDVSSRQDEALTVKPSRVQVSVASGKAALFDTAEGKTHSFACADGARSMSVNELDRVAFNSVAE